MISLIGPSCLQWLRIIPPAFKGHCHPKKRKPVMNRLAGFNQPALEFLDPDMTICSLSKKSPPWPAIFD